MDYVLKCRPRGRFLVFTTDMLPPAEWLMVKGQAESPRGNCKIPWQALFNFDISRQMGGSFFRDFRGRKLNEQFPVRAIPDPQDPILPPGDHPGPVGRDRGGFNEVARAGKAANLVSILAQQADFAVAGGGQGLVRVADESDRSDLFVETGDVFLPFAVEKIPDFDHVVRARAGECALVAVPTDPQHVMRVPFELLDNFSSGNLGHLDKLVRGARCQVFSVRA